MQFWKKPLNIKDILLRSALIAGCIVLCFFLMRVTVNGFVLTSIGASTFIAFAFPQAESARPRYLVGGYACGIVAGLIGYAVMQAMLRNDSLDSFFAVATGSVLSVFVASVFMMVLSFQHPPAAALAISIVIDKEPAKVAVIAFICVVVVALVKWLVVYTEKKRAAAKENTKSNPQEKSRKI